MIDQDLHAAAFPRLDKAQLAALEGCPLSKLKHYRHGEKLFDAAQRDFRRGRILLHESNTAFYPKPVEWGRRTRIFAARQCTDCV